MPDAAIPSEIVEIIGVISQICGLGKYLLGEDLWEFWIIFERWKLESGEVQEKQSLRLSREATSEELNSLEERVSPGALIRVRAEGIKASSSWGKLLSITGPDHSDARLNEYFAGLLKPVILEDPVLGNLTLFRGNKFFSAETVWNSGAVRLELLVENESELQSVISLAKELWKNQIVWHQRILDYATQWLTRKTRLTIDQLDDLFPLEVIAIYPDQKFELWFDDFRGVFSTEDGFVVGGNIPDGPTGAWFI